MRTELAVRDAYPGMSRREAILLCERGGVRDARGVKLKKGTQIDDGAVLSVDLTLLDERSEADRLVLRGKQNDLVWLASGEQWAAIRKPAGLGSLQRHFGDTLHFAEYARQLVHERAGKNLSALPDFGVVHRLDHGTSGVMLVAYDQPTLDQFVADRGHTLFRTYWAMARGVALEEGVIETPIEHPGEKPQPALTRYRVLSRSGPIALFEARIQGGRRHQIRKHMASIGAPLLGDGRYGEAPAARLALHAWQLDFTFAGKPLQIQADPGAHFWQFAPDLVRPSSPFTE